MGRSSDDWADRFEDHPAKTAFQVVILAVIGILIIIGVIWGIATVVSYVRGRGDAIQEKNSAQNWITAQAQFNQESQDFSNSIEEISLAQKQLTSVQSETLSQPLSQYSQTQEENNLQTDIQGLEQQCSTIAGNYNAQSQNYLSENWKNANLPQSLNADECH